ncbi:MAG: phosphomannomutase/phosphoglucomutase [Gammaproteobacteria bacterium]
MILMHLSGAKGALGILVTYSKEKEMRWRKTKEPLSIKKLTVRTITNISLSILAICTMVFVGSFLFISKVQNQRLADFLVFSYAQQFHQVFSKVTQDFSNDIHQELMGSSASMLDEASWQMKMNALQNREPSIKALHIIRPKQQEPAEGQAALGYAAIDMANRVFKGDLVLPELHRVEEGRFYINHAIALRKTQQSEVIGVAVVSEDLMLLQKLLNNFKKIPGYIELRETLLGQNRIIAKSDRIELAGVGAQSILMVPGTSWQMTFWLDPEFGTTFSTGIGALLIVVILMILCCTAFIWHYFRRIEGALLEDGRGLGLMLQAVLDGVPPKSDFFHFASNEKLSEYIHQLGAIPKNFKLLNAKQDSAAVLDWAVVSEVNVEVSPHIFRAYDIRGIAGETLTTGVMHLLGKSIGTEIIQKNNRPLVFGRDGRLSGDELSIAFCEGIRSTGVKIIDIGIVPTPLVYFGAYHLDTGNAVMLTGSHNPPQYNGLKIVINKETLAQDKIQALYDRIKLGHFETGEGEYQKRDLLFDYLAKVTRDIKLARPLKIVVDAGNGVGGVLAVPLLKALGCEVIEMFCEVDGNFPNHHPDPSQPSNLFALIEMVQTYHADLGLALDGDGDRLGVVTPQGEIIWPDRLMMLFAEDVLSRHPGSPILYDVKCSKELAEVIRHAGGKPIMCATGHSLVKRAMKEEGGILAGEMSGHFFFSENWYGFDDACFAAVKLLAFIAAHPTQSSIDVIFEKYPKAIATPEINIAISDEEKFKFIEQFKSNHDLKAEKIITIDGLRAEFDDGWGLVRASNTTPVLVLRFEAESQAALKRIQADFKIALLKINSKLEIPF